MPQPGSRRAGKRRRRPCLGDVFGEVEAADEDDAAAGLVEGGDAGVGEPALVDKGVEQLAGEVCVGAAAGALALDAHQDGLGGVGVEKGADGGVQVGEPGRAGEADGEGGVDEGHAVAGVGVDVDADVEEADAVVELGADVDGLAADGGQGDVAGRAVVGAGQREGRQRPGAVDGAHPGGEDGAAHDGEVGAARRVDGREGGRAGLGAVGVVDGLQLDAVGRGARDVDDIAAVDEALAAAIVKGALDGQPEDLARRIACQERGLARLKRTDAQVADLVAAAGRGGADIARGRRRGAPEQVGDAAKNAAATHVEALDADDREGRHGQVADRKIDHDLDGRRR